MATWAYDIECEDWDKLVVACAASDEGDRLVFHSDGETADWYKSLDKSDEVIAHNGGAYDFLQLIAATPDLSWSGTLAGAAIISCRAKGGALCRDSYRLFPLSLAKWTGEKSDTGLPCRCERRDERRADGDAKWHEGCGGYCSIRRDMPRAWLRRLTDYCMNDCTALLRRWKEDVARLEGDGLVVLNSRGVMRSTIGGVAWATGAEMAGIDAAQEIEWGDYDAGRRAYYGGRTEVGRRFYAGIAHRYDVHAMYPWALTLDVPFGVRRSYVGAEASRVYSRKPLGLYRATVQIPRTDIPMLPHRYEGRNKGRFHTDRLLWATGTIDGWWSGVELRAAEAHGATIERIHTAEVWSKAGPLFGPYVEHVYKMRRRAVENGDDRWGAVLKWFANSLSGKLAQRPGVSSLVVRGREDELGDDWIQHGGETSRVYSRATSRTSSSGMTWCAATLTARARVKLLDRLMRHTGRWLYCDTDSTYLCDRDERGVHESRLGTFGYEGEAHEWHALAPKLYRYRDEHGKPYVRARGVSRATWGAYDELRAGREVTRAGGVQRIRSSGGDFVAREVTRSYRDFGTEWCGTRIVMRGGITRPLHRSSDGSYY